MSVSTQRIWHRPHRKVSTAGVVSGVVVVVLAWWTIPLDAALIRFHRTARVTASVVRLGDVADVYDADGRREEELRQIVLAPAPPPGRQTVLDFVSIRSRLEARGVDLSATEFSGPTRVLVSRPEAPRQKPQPTPSQSQARLAERKVVQAVYRQLRTLVRDASGVQVTVRLQQPDVPLVLSADAETLEVLGLQPRLDVPQTLTLRLLDGGQFPREIQLVCRLTARPTVLTVRYPVPRGKVLQPEDLTVVAVDEPSGALARADEVVGKEAVRTLRPGEPIRPEDVRTVPLVRRNDIVTVYCRAGGIVVRRPFRARDEGARGDVITLVSLDGRETITATVTGYHEAEVVRTGSVVRASYQDATGAIRFEPFVPPVRPRPQAQGGNRP